MELEGIISSKWSEIVNSSDEYLQVHLGVYTPPWHLCLWFWEALRHPAASHSSLYQRYDMITLSWLPVFWTLNLIGWLSLHCLLVFFLELWSVLSLGPYFFVLHTKTWSPRYLLGWGRPLHCIVVLYVGEGSDMERKNGHFCCNNSAADWIGSKGHPGLGPGSP